MPAKLYPWDLWFKKRRFVLKQGRHYYCEQSSMAQQIRNAASRRNLLIALVESHEQFTVIVENATNAIN